MSANSKIEWTDHTFNPWIGCTKVSPGCAHCYAESEDKRRGWTEGGWGKGKPRKRTSAANWKLPLKWNRLAASCGTYEGSEWCPVCSGPAGPHRPRVFCASLADWLDDEVPIEWLADLLALIHATPNLDWLLLTKRPENWQQRIERAALHYSAVEHDGACAMLQSWLFADKPRTIGHYAPPANVWIGTSVEDQQRADERIPALLKIPARIRFLSCEPLLGSVNLKLDHCVADVDATRAQMLHWAIVGGESGAGARACAVQWVRSLVAQCKAAGVAAFVKQLGALVVDRNDAGFDGESPREWPMGTDTRDIDSGYQGAPVRVLVTDRKGGDWNEWPEDLRVREFPA